MPEGEAQGIAIHPVRGIGEVHPGDDLASMLIVALQSPSSGSPALSSGDVLVVTQKVISKAEGRIISLDGTDPDAKRRVVEGESVRILRRRGDLMITETVHGFVCANAGVDLSNVADGTAALLPVDPDRSARRIRSEVQRSMGIHVGVIISDTFGRAWRQGVIDVAIGCAGIAAIVDLRGSTDAAGRTLVATEICVADEIASAAELVMGKDHNIPAAVVRGVPSEWLRDGSVSGEVIRPPKDDLFR
ncbi:MAG: coenzyme F420-0:L-glutamate ligase [Acidimicrobiales bacterium]